MIVLTSADGRWRIEQRRDGFTVRWHPDPARRGNVVVLERASLDQVATFLLDRGLNLDDFQPA